LPRTIAEEDEVLGELSTHSCYRKEKSKEGKEEIVC